MILKSVIMNKIKGDFMDIDKLRIILKEHKLYVKDTSNGKNIISICPICGDHPNPSKKGHLYISTDPSIPLAHCFYSSCVSSISELVKKITGDKNLANEVISKDEEKKSKYTNKVLSSNKSRTREFNIPELDKVKYKHKSDYLEKRCMNRLKSEDIPNIIFDFKSFFDINKLDLVGDGKVLSMKEYNILCDHHVGFLSKHNTTIYCRSCRDDIWMKFKKLSLQSDNLHLLDYWSIPGGNINSNTVVLSEGNFDILGEYVSDSLNIKDSVRVFASGNSFTYSSLLKSVCFDENLYRCNVIILSDIDKEPKWYIKFKNENSHVIESLQIWGNKNGKDFGTFPIKPFLYTETKFIDWNKSKNGSKRNY